MNITLDIINQKNKIFEIITFGQSFQIRRSMFSFLNALELLRGKFNIINPVNNDINLYAEFQKAMLMELLGNSLESLQITLESYGYSIDDFIEKTMPIDFKNIKRFIQLELMAIEEFTLFLEPKAIEYKMPAGIGPIPDIKKFIGRKPSEKYVEAMTSYTSFMSSPGLHDEMIKTLGSIISMDTLLDNRSFVPVIRRKRYSQISDDIRLINYSFENKTDYKASAADEVIFEKKRLISKSYYTDNGLFALIWAELKYAIENDIYARQCECGKYFVPIPMQRYKCPDGCKEKLRKEREMRKYSDYHEYIRLKKRKSRALPEHKAAIQAEIDKLKIK